MTSEFDKLGPCTDCGAEYPASYKPYRILDGKIFCRRCYINRTVK